MILSMEAFFMLCGTDTAYHISACICNQIGLLFFSSNPEIEGKGEKQTNWQKKQKEKPIEQKVQGGNNQGGEKPYPS